MGRAYVVCRPCRRFVPLGTWLDRRDTRMTSFSCSVCGGAGDIVLDDPAREGLQHDPRPSPLRHRMAALRLQQHHGLADHYGQKSAAREVLPQAERRRREPEPRYRLRAMPFTTFGELSALGLALEVWCAGCKSRRPVGIGERLAGRRFGRARFICEGQCHDGTPCGGFGHPVVVPVVAVDRARGFVSMSCGRCLPPWEANDVQLDRPPWSAAPIDASRERYRCPGCGGQVHGVFHRGGSGAAVGGHLMASGPTASACRPGALG